MKLWVAAALFLSVSSCSGRQGGETGLPAGGGGNPQGGSGGAGGSSAGGTGALGGSGGGAAGSCPTGQSVVHFTTDDGVKLEADDYSTGVVAGPSVVLLHMVPPANDRKNYPKELIDALLAKQIHVLNVDRRGAGGSEGDPVEAYQGDKGKLDVKAAVQFLLQSACQPDPLRIGVVGASNGTTSALDYVVLTESDALQPLPSALVFLTGGTYTENQNKVNDHRDVLEPIPIQLVYSTAERDWSVGFQPGAPATWRFQEYDPGAHGTGMFAARPESIALVADFLGDVL